MRAKLFCLICVSALQPAITPETLVNPFKVINQDYGDIVSMIIELSAKYMTPKFLLWLLESATANMFMINGDDNFQKKDLNGL